MRVWLKKAREHADLNHGEVADGAGISRSYYTNIENGIKTPSVKAAKSIAEVLKFPWENFFKDNCSLKEQLLETQRKEVG
ncbi:transcriptional regulator with XRE-family HTH domain [Fontibacillus solani]|uniref:Transcriptional regulator with XRE-family HTH domain n=1 Tax=Fontibacillus solani TaxID=1572857 RepID=A0A7W3SUT3_9BACL|nr:helix-turn-helix transcriptional regulator [Fontibacillus solani]MBA9086545.1 transcriptional regulator with XRE-family HTH domain [Fontibacillus solani]